MGRWVCRQICMYCTYVRCVYAACFLVWPSGSYIITTVYRGVVVPIPRSARPHFLFHDNVDALAAKPVAKCFSSIPQNDSRFAFQTWYQPFFSFSILRPSHSRVWPARTPNGPNSNHQTRTAANALSRSRKMRRGAFWR